MLLCMTVLMNTNIRCGETLAWRQPGNCLRGYGVRAAGARKRKSKDNKFGVFFGQSLGGWGGWSGSRYGPGVAATPGMELMPRRAVTRRHRGHGPILMWRPSPPRTGHHTGAALSAAGSVPGPAHYITHGGAPAVTTLIENEMRLEPPETIHD